MDTAKVGAVALQEEHTYFCGVNYREEDYMMQESAEEDALRELPAMLKRLEEHVRILEEEDVELINVPVPEFSDSDPADIVHDFNRVRSRGILHVFTVTTVHNYTFPARVLRHFFSQ